MLLRCGAESFCYPVQTYTMPSTVSADSAGKHVPRTIFAAELLNPTSSQSRMHQDAIRFINPGQISRTHYLTQQSNTRAASPFTQLLIMKQSLQSYALVFQCMHMMHPPACSTSPI